VMQSSTAAIALTLSAHYAGAVGLDQAYALIIGQNIGTATSFAMASRLAKTAGNDERQNFRPVIRSSTASQMKREPAISREH
jgi:Na+/phosphate symporter